MAEKTFWNFEPCKATRGTGVMVDSPEFPQFWGRREGLVGKRLPVVKVEYGDQVFYLDDRDGSGWFKVTVGRGGPGYRHGSLDVEGFTAEPRLFPEGGISL